MTRFRSSFAAPTGFVAAVIRIKPRSTAEIVQMAASSARLSAPAPVAVTRQAA